MSDKQSRIFVISIVVLIVIFCVVGGVTAVYVGRELLQRESGVGTAVIELVPLENGRSLNEQGILITSVIPDSPAAQAGLKRGHIILSIDDTPTNTPQELQQIIQSHDVGDSLALTVLNGDDTEAVTVTLGSRGPYLGVGVMGTAPIPDPNQPAPPPGLPYPPPPPEPPALPFPDGFPGGLFGRPAIIGGIVADSPAAAAGLQAEDVITNIDDKAILTTDELVENLTSKSANDAINLIVRRGRDTLAFTVTLAPHPDDPNRGFLGIELQSGP